ncbi:MAG: hypothetical protein JF571_08515 [Asticcacaulis sp.]|nr:hypothetical protein [Asticcacaulis sp.]
MAFASRSVAEHLVRGVLGFGALGAAVHFADQHPWLSVALGILALAAFRGCPVCWLTGMIETVAYAVLRRHEKPGP